MWAGHSAWLAPGCALFHSGLSAQEEESLFLHRCVPISVKKLGVQQKQTIPVSPFLGIVLFNKTDNIQFCGLMINHKAQERLWSENLSFTQKLPLGFQIVS